MKKKTFADENPTILQDFFTEELPSENQLAVNRNFALQETAKPESDLFLDKVLSVIKWIFFYVPGVAVIYMAMMVPALMFFYGDLRLLELLGVLGFLPVGAFLIMLNFGKLRDLKYLKSVLTIIAFSFLTAVFYDILAVFVKGDFLGLYAKLTLPLILIVGMISKRNLDQDDKD